MKLGIRFDSIIVSIATVILPLLAATLMFGCNTPRPRASFADDATIVVHFQGAGLGHELITNRSQLGFTVNFPVSLITTNPVFRNKTGGVAFLTFEPGPLSSEPWRPVRLSEHQEYQPGKLVGAIVGYVGQPMPFLGLGSIENNEPTPDRLDVLEHYPCSQLELRLAIDGRGQEFLLEIVPRAGAKSGPACLASSA
jgi:hypothetical protein